MLRSLREFLSDNPKTSLLSEQSRKVRHLRYTYRMETLKQKGEMFDVCSSLLSSLYKGKHLSITSYYGNQPSGIYMFSYENPHADWYTSSVLVKKELEQWECDYLKDPQKEFSSENLLEVTPLQDNLSNTKYIYRHEEQDPDSGEVATEYYSVSLI